MEGQVNARLNITGNPSFFCHSLEYGSVAPYLHENIATKAFSKNIYKIATVRSQQTDAAKAQT